MKQSVTSRPTSKLTLAGIGAAAYSLALTPYVYAQVTMPDASGIIDTAETTFVAVGGLVVAIVGFFVIVKIVKWVRK